MPRPASATTFLWRALPWRDFARVLSLNRPADAQVSHVRDRVTSSRLDRRGIRPADRPPQGGVARAGRSAGSPLARRPIAGCRSPGWATLASSAGSSWSLNTGRTAPSGSSSTSRSESNRSPAFSRRSAETTTTLRAAYASSRAARSSRKSVSWSTAPITVGQRLSPSRIAFRSRRVSRSYGTSATERASKVSRRLRLRRLGTGPART